jgi:hypothetical protein
MIKVEEDYFGGIYIPGFRWDEYHLRLRRVGKSNKRKGAWLPSFGD